MCRNLWWKSRLPEGTGLHQSSVGPWHVKTVRFKAQSSPWAAQNSLSSPHFSPWITMAPPHRLSSALSPTSCIENWGSGAAWATQPAGGRDCYKLNVCAPHSLQFMCWNLIPNKWSPYKWNYYAYKRDTSIPGVSVVKNQSANREDAASIPESGGSPGVGNGHPLQYSCLENPMDRGAWWASVSVQFSSVQSLSPVRLFATPWIPARQAFLSITNSQSLLKLMPIESVMPSNHLILCRPLLLLPPILPRIRVFSNESTLRMRWPKYWSFSFSISPANEHPGLISFRMWSPCSPRDSQESSPTPQSKSINFSMLSFLHSPTLTSIHDHWKNHSLD